MWKKNRDRENSEIKRMKSNKRSEKYHSESDSPSDPGAKRPGFLPNNLRLASGTQAYQLPGGSSSQYGGSSTSQYGKSEQAFSEPSPRQQPSPSYEKRVPSISERSPRRVSERRLSHSSHHSSNPGKISENSQIHDSVKDELQDGSDSQSETERAQTVHYELGDMNRTYIEGMLPPGVATQYHKTHQGRRSRR